MEKHTITLLKSIRKEVQLCVILTDAALTLYVLWLIVTNASHWLPGILLGYTPAGVWLLLRANRLFHLCLLHRSMLLHSFAVYACCVWQSQCGFGEWLYPMRWLMLISGLLLLLWLIRNQRPHPQPRPEAGRT